MTDLETLQLALTTVEAQRAHLGAAVADHLLALVREKIAQVSPTALAPQRKFVTIFFADVSEFTALSETLDAEDVGEVMNTLWQTVDRILVAHGGTIDKHIGDAVMALWGSQAGREDDPENAVRAALAVQAELKTLNAARGWSLKMRIGIHSGLVFLSATGIQGEFSAIGDAVNVAARLEQTALAESILISHDTYQHVHGIFTVTRLESISVKGRAKPIQVYQVLNAKPHTFRLQMRGIEGVTTGLIGRSTEEHILHTAFETVLTQRQARRLFLIGEAGIGKSRLLHDYTVWLELRPEEIRFFKGRTDQQMSHRPYALWRDLFNFRFDIQDTDSPETARAKFTAGMAQLTQTDSEKIAHFIGHLLGLDFSASPYVRSALADAQQFRELAFEHLTQFFLRVTALRPLTVIFFEDLHWADEDSIELLEHLWQTTRAYPILIIGLARPMLLERRSDWGHPTDESFSLSIPPLSPADSRQLVREILQRLPEIPLELEDLIARQAEGYPYYIEEFIKVLIEDRVIIKSVDPDGPWHVNASQLAKVRIPPTLAGILQARLDGLPLAERTLLQQAAVIGRTFWNSAVAYLNQQDTEAHDAVDAAEIDRLCEQLQNKEFLQQHATSLFAGTRECVFQHTLLYEVVYELVLKRRRQTYHLWAAQWLMTHSQITEDAPATWGYAGWIAEHLEKAGELAQAAYWYERAAQYAQTSYTLAKAQHYYEKALALLPAEAAYLPNRLKLYEALGLMFRLQIRYPEALAALHEMRLITEQLGDQVAQARAWAAMAWVQNNRGDHLTAFESGGKAVACAEQANAPQTLAGALYTQGWALYRLGRAAEAQAISERMLAIASAVNAQNEMAQSYNLQGAVYGLLSDLPHAIEYAQHALSLYRELGNINRVIVMLNNVGEDYLLLGDYEQAMTCYNEALPLVQEAGGQETEWTLRCSIAAAQVGLGNYAKAETELRSVLTSIGDTVWDELPHAYRTLAQAYLGQEQWLESLQAAHRSLTMASDSQNPTDIAETHRVLGEIHSAQWQATGTATVDLETIRTYFTESAQKFVEIGAINERARTLRAWAKHELALGDHATALGLLTEAIDIFRKLNMALEIQRSEKFLAGV